uniref:PUM-HD domain-containing protein n=1 Tax=Oryza meridionalis TaxID=40149 RepID=A0A0E0EX93_9ORYZ
MLIMHLCFICPCLNGLQLLLRCIFTMVCFGSKALRRKGDKQRCLPEGDLDDSLPMRRGRKDKSEKPRKGGSSSSNRPSAEKAKHGRKKSGDGKKSKGHGKGRHSDSSIERNPGHMKNDNTLLPSKASKPVTNVLRKRVDPETAKYFLEISNLFDNKEIDLEERATICANALEETKGKELELATDGPISHTLQVLVEGCELEQLCVFLHNSIESFHIIAIDKFGSHVAEAALKSLATHLEDEASRGIIEDILIRICKVIAGDAANVMSSCYGSHVLRTLLCLCKGVPLQSLQDFHTTKRSAVLAERLSCGSTRSGGSDPKNQGCGFSDIFKSFVREMLQNAKYDIATLETDKNSSLVLQTALKLSAGDDHELNYIISILLGFDEDDTAQKKDCSEQKNEIIALLEDTAYSHLLEVIVEVAPEELRNNMLTGTLKGALFAISSHHCGNYVVQALVASAKTSDQMEQIWDELGSRINELLELGKAGVVASILAACQRLETKRLESSQVLSAALSSNSESSDSIVAHMLFLENYLHHQKSSWEWPFGAKMSVLGCLMLQSILQYPHQYIRPYVASLLAMDDNKILQISKDSGGSRVLEAFLCSSATAKRKFKVFAKLQGHYGEIAMNPSGSFLVEKCFTASNFSHKEAIVAELLAVQTELSRTRHGFHLLKKLDVDRYSRRPDQWRASQTSKETTHREFQVEFGLSSKGAGQNIEELLTSRSPSKKDKQKDKTDVVTEDVSTNKPDLSDVGKTKRIKSEKTTCEKESSNKKPTNEDSGSSMAFLKNSAKRKSPGFLSDKPSFKKRKHHKPNAGNSSGKMFIRDSAGTPFVRNSGKQKRLVAELADLAGWEAAILFTISPQLLRVMSFSELVSKDSVYMAHTSIHELQSDLWLLKMKKKSCHGRATHDPQHGLSKIAGESTKHQQGNISGSQAAAAAKSKPWKKRYLTFLSKFQNKMKKHKKPDNIKAHHSRSHKNRRILLSRSQIMEECSNLVQVIRHTAADCFTAAATAVAAAVDYEEDDHHQPYMQLDQVNYGVMKREAFGPVYLVT